MSPLVSILIPVYNCHPWVARAVESALEQTWPNIEVIALDDASTDGSWEMLQEWRSKIRIERSPRNGGQNVSRNLLTTLSRGEWLVFLDADDELAPDSVEQKMRLADAAEAVYGSTDCSTFEEQKLLSSVKTVAVDYEDMLSALFSWKLPNTSAYAFQKKALLDAGGWNESAVKFADYGMCIPMLLQGCRFQAAPQAWSTYRQWSSKQVSRESILQSSLVWLKLLRDATQEMEQRNLMTQARGQAIFDSSLGTIKRIYQFDRSRALLEHRALQDWSRSFTPSVPPFTANYSRLYRWLGFVLAERLNTIRRRFKHVACEDRRS
jgi:glycosyltransferase involved in cell wall biosynthesis